MLRALFISLSENRSLRGMAERSAIGRRLSSRFVAGTQVDDALRVTQTVNQSGLSVSVDNLGENVTNAEEARASAQLYHQMLDEISDRQLNANVSLKLTHMGLDVDEKLARDLVTGLVAKAATMNPRNFVRVDMEGSPYTQRTLDFVYELHRMPGHAGAVGAVIQSYMRRAEKDIEELLAEAHPYSPVQGGLQRAGRDCLPEKIRSGRELRPADENSDEERRLSRPGDARREDHQSGQSICHAGKYSTRRL